MYILLSENLMKYTFSIETLIKAKNASSTVNNFWTVAPIELVFFFEMEYFLSVESDSGRKIRIRGEKSTGGVTFDVTFAVIKKF